MNPKQQSEIQGYCIRTAMTCLVFLGVMVLLCTGIPFAAGQDLKPLTILETMRAGRHERHTSVVFQFESLFQMDKPERVEDEIRFKLRSVKTQLIPYRKYLISESWIRLEPQGDDIDVRLGLLGPFSTFKYYALENPDRLVVNLIWPQQEENANELDTEKKVPATQVTSPVAQVKEVSKTEPQPASPETVPISQPAHDPEAPAASLAKAVVNDQQAITKTVDTQGNQNPKPSVAPPTKKAETPSAVSDAIKKESLMTLNFYQSDIQEVLSALAIQQNINIVTEKDVSGDITVHLYKVPFDNALGAICQSGGFAYYKQANIYYIYKPKVETEPLNEALEMRIFKLEYAEIDKIQQVLDALPNTRLIKIHEPTKSIIVEDTAENIKKVERLIRHWDVKPRQVMIEAKILEITLTDAMSFGVNWESMLGGNLAIGTSGISLSDLPGRKGESPSPSDGVGFFGNFITGAGTDWQFAAALDALEAETDIDTLSTPKILAIHGKAAQVQVGGQQGYTVTTVSDGFATTSVEFIDTGTILDITPYIDSDNNVLLKVEPSINSATIEEGVPVVRSTNVTTWMMAANGETVFIAGLIQNTQSSLTSSVPCLGDIPILGNLFGRTSDVSKKTELVILITPHVVLDNTDIYREEIERTDAFEEKLK